MNVAKLMAAAALAVALVAPGALRAGEAAEPADPLTALVNSMPDCDRDGKHTGPAIAVAQKAVLQILGDGKKNVTALIDMLVEPDKGEDYKAHYLLHAVAIHVARPGSEEERKAFCETLVAALAQERPAIIKKYLLEELLWIGGEESVAALSRLVLDKELHDFAIRALVNVKASAPLRAALPKAKGRNRTALTQALGALRDGKAVTEMLPDVTHPDRDLRLAAMAALANIGDAAAVEPMLKAMAVESAYERSQVINSLLSLAQRLGEAGEKQGAERICRHLLKTCGEREFHYRCGALIALAQAVGGDAMDDVLTAMSSENPTLRAAGLQAAVTMPGAKATALWVSRMKGADAARRVAILGLLARRGDPAALPAILEAAKDPDESVRVAALNAAGPAGDERAVAPLTAALTGKSGAESIAARRALLRIPGEGATAAMAKAIPDASPALRTLLLDLLASRDGKAHLDVILACTKDADDRVRAAAIEALGKLADAKDLPLLTGRSRGASSARPRRRWPARASASATRTGASLPSPPPSRRPRAMRASPSTASWPASAAARRSRSSAPASRTGTTR